MSVKLTEYEREMLQGKQGKAKQIAIEVIIKLANAFGAEELVRVVSVQGICTYNSLNFAGLEWLEKLANAGGKCCVPMTQDPGSIPFNCWRDIGIPQEYAELQYRLRDVSIRLGEIQNWSCTPFYQGNIPRFGQNIAWAESSAVSFANSALGARSNRTPAGLAICAGITGRIPKYGLYLDENRFADVKIMLETGDLSDIDYNALGTLLGRKMGPRIPCIYGLSLYTTNDNLKYMGASAASTGSVALYHAIGVTPEALSSDPFGNKKPHEEVVVTRQDLDEEIQSLCTEQAGEPYLAAVGCPHCSINELIEIARLMKDRKLQEGKEFWIYTTIENENTLDRMGLLTPLKAAGARILSSTCLVIHPFAKEGETVITNSGKFAVYLPIEHHVKIKFACLEECVYSVSKSC